MNTTVSTTFATGRPDADVDTPTAGTYVPITKYRSVRSTAMNTMHEALAREHMRQREHEARRQRLAGELAAANRWHYLERRAHAAYRRHAQRALRAAEASAVAE